MKKQTLLWAFSFLVVSVVLPVQAQSYLTNGLVAFFPFDGNANDGSGNGRNGTISGATLATDRFGQTNAAMNFSGSARISVPLNYNFTANSATISAWFLTRVVYNTGTPQSFLCDFRNNNSTPNLFANVDATLLQSFGASVMTAPSLVTNRWYHFVATYNNTGAVTEIFINGVRRHSVSNSPVTIGQTGTGNLGTRYNSTEFLNGILDDVRIYNRALNSNEVSQLFAYEANAPLAIRTAVELSWTMLTNQNYQIQSSVDLNNWTNVGSPFVGGGFTNKFFSVNGTNLFYRLILQ